MNTSRTLAAATILAFFSFQFAGAQIPKYRVVDISRFVPNAISAQAINNRGEVLCETRHSNVVRTVLLRKKKATDVSPDEARLQAWPSHLNEHGVVAGYAPNGSDANPFIYSKHSGTVLFTHLGGLSIWRILGLNNNNDMIVTSDRAWVFVQAETITPLPGYEHFVNMGATKILNDRGQMTGGMISAGYHAIIVTTNGLTDLGVPAGWAGTIGRAINNAGHVTGSLLKTGDTYTDIDAFVYRDGAMTNIGRLAGTESTEPAAINETDAVVGTSYRYVAPTYYNPGHPEPSGFLWVNGVMYNLNDCVTNTVTIRYVYDINDAGVIVGNGSIQSRIGAIMLVPANAAARAAAVKKAHPRR